jgi:hypothetical protein
MIVPVSGGGSSCSGTVSGVVAAGVALDATRVSAESGDAWRHAAMTRMAPTIADGRRHRAAEARMTLSVCTCEEC